MSLIIFPIVFILAGTIQEPYEKYDQNSIQKNGAVHTAKILNIREVENVTINGQHPRLFYYGYTLNGKNFTDIFQTMDLDKAAAIEMSDNVTIKVYKGQSIITGFEPFTFPMYIFFLFPLPFFMIGSIFLCIALLPALKNYKLYRDGILQEATVTSLTPLAGRTPLDKGSVLVTYKFLTSSGQTFHGETSTRDFSILSFKKVGDPIKIFVSKNDGTTSCMAPEREAWVQSKFV